MKPRLVSFLKEQLVPVVICFGLAVALGSTSWLQRLENTTLDLVTQFRSNPKVRNLLSLPASSADPRVVTVGIDDSSIEGYGRWPWDRKVHAKFMYGVSFGKPPVVAWDILFVEPSADQSSDEVLQAAAAELKGRVVFGAYATNDDPSQPALEHAHNQPLTRIEGDLSRLPTSDFALRPIPQLQQVGQTAFCDTPPGTDGMRRTVPMLQQVGGQVYPSLSLQTLMVYAGIRPEQVRIVLGDAIYLEGDTFKRRIPINEKGLYFVNYRYAIKGANIVSYERLTENYYANYVKNEPVDGLPVIDDKILIVGQVSTGLSDNGVTPFGAETPLVLVHANVIDNILNEDYAYVCPQLPIFLIGVLLGVCGLVFLSKRSLAAKCTYALSLLVLYFVTAAALWVCKGAVLPFLWPTLGFLGLQIFMIVQQLIREQRSKQHIKGMFGTYVSPDLVNRMIESGQSPQLGGHEETITAYFSDIQAFSAFSEKLPPDRLGELMNEYLTACTDIIQEEGGTLDKYIGDAVVAMFGAPLPLPDHAFRACVAGQRIHLKLAELRAKWKSQGALWPEIVHEMQSRIGLNTGSAIVGNFGSRTRFAYTMLGDNVNLAARMESGAKSWGVYSMCTEATRTACERDGGDRVVFRALGRIVVKGRTSAVPIFEIVGLKENVSDQTRECLRLFEAGLARYYVRDWEGALALFSQSQALEPNQPGITPGVGSNPSRIYTEIVGRYQIAPPPENWEGEYVMTVK
ncbi:CHASE2 domain-containing protein [Rariglobus hedericola]|uniref:Adenylate/guanylate cyclase domain-containing protein n=1 Tax=Rariglobus hedericola TaxID=2597822 RepID=A0A556QQY3_9BACT|nr:adenylate/guanylate cyclase domain-containing protein [Rariglobus hedericola]TSJ79040.1 adenylate/guanylate cyclase domain-containing protein [Rariglobus hedericola]